LTAPPRLNRPLGHVSIGTPLLSNNHNHPTFQNIIIHPTKSIIINITNIIKNNAKQIGGDSVEVPMSCLTEMLTSIDKDNN
jgi:hypothetical protein